MDSIEGECFGGKEEKKEKKVSFFFLAVEQGSLFSLSLFSLSLFSLSLSFLSLFSLFSLSPSLPLSPGPGGS